MSKTFDEFTTPVKKQKQRVSKTTASRPIMSPIYTPKGWQNKRVFLVYQRPRDHDGGDDGNHVDDDDEPKRGRGIKKVADKNQGVWTEGYVSASNPQELWVFDKDNVPPDLISVQNQNEHDDSVVSSSLSPARKAKKATSTNSNDVVKSPRTPKKTSTSGGQSRHIYGIWGYKPGGDPNDPCDVWFYPPEYVVAEEVGDTANASTKSDRQIKTLPRFFTPRGYWTYPLVKNHTSEIAPEATGWLGLASSPKIEKLDVGGTWKMLYKQGGLDGDDGDSEGIKGPGMKSPRQALQSPTRKKYLQVSVETPDGKRIPLDILPSDTIETVKDKIYETEGIPKSEQRLLSPKGKYGNYTTLPDTRTLRDCGVKNGDVLRLEGMQLHIKNNFDPSLQKHVFIIDVRNDQTTLAKLKRLINAQEGIDIDDQVLSIDQKTLDDDTLNLRDYGIQQGDALQLDPWQVVVHDPSDGEEFILTVHPKDTVSMLISKIERQEGIPVQFINLSYDMRPLDQPWKTLKEYNIRHLSRLDLQSIELIVERPRNKGPIRLLGLSPNDTLQKVKEQIEKKTGIVVSVQRLLVGGKDIDQDKKNNDQKLRDLNLENGDVLRLQGIEVNVQHWKGKKKYTLRDLSPDVDTVQDIKQMLCKEYGISTPRLSYQGRPLSRQTNTLTDYDIQHQATLKLEQCEITIVTRRGESISCNVDLSKDTLVDVRKHMFQRCNLPMDEQRFVFDNKNLDDTKNPSKTLESYGLIHGSTLQLQDTVVLIENKATGASFSLVVDLSDTISNLKATIHRHPHGLPKAFQNLTLNKESLSSITEERTLRECSIKHNDTLLLDDIEIKIQLPDSRTTTIRVAPTATIGHVMSSIENFDGSPFDEQLVTENGEILDDRKKTLFDCQVPHKSMLFVKPMQINIDMPSGKTIPIVVSPHDTILNIKSKLEQKESIPVADQKLTLNDKELADTKTISQYGIKHGTTLNLAGMLIFIQHFNGNTLKLPVVATNTLLDVKKMVQTSEKTPTNEQNIVFGGSLLCHDDRTLCDFKIKNRATLKLEPMKIYVQAPTGKFPLVVEPTLKVLVLKGMIQEKVGTAPQDQTLLHHGDELSDLEATLTVCGLQHLDTVNLEVKGQPTYKVKLGEYQSAFEFVPSPRKKREGVRARKTINTLGDFHSTIAGNEVCKFGHKTG